MLHVYCGQGKGKTTAAFGLASRAAGRERRVVIAQFLKSEDSGERRSMEYVPHVLLLPLPEQVKFVFQMNVVERAECESDSHRLLWDAVALAEQTGLVVLDEALGALETGILLEEDLLRALDEMPPECEVVLTGRVAPQSILDRADYVTEMTLRRHPFERGIPAREGIEF